MYTNTLNTITARTMSLMRSQEFYHYIKGLSENIYHTLKKCSFDILFAVLKKLDKVIKKRKDNLSKLKKTEVVYKINCKDCNASYIGQTKWHLETRIKQHRNDIKKHESNHSVVSKHRIEFKHNFWSEPDILHSEKHTRKRIGWDVLY